MAQNDGIRRYIEAALALTQITRSRAEEVVHDLIRAGEVESTKAQDWVEDLVRTSRQRSEAFASSVHTEVRRQLSDMGLSDINDLARRVAVILDKAGTAAKRAGRGATGRARPARRVTKKAAKKAPARKVSSAKKVAKKAPARKVSSAKKVAKKSTTKKTPARRTAAAKKRSSGTSAARRRS